jgi:hypothetical protein
MTLLHKVIAFIIGFSGLFYFVRTNELYNTKILLADLGGIPWLYSTIGMIFSIIAAFAIQKELENWNNLVEAVKSEIDAIEELWLWAEYLPNDVGKRIKESIEKYLEVVIREGWQKSERGERSEAAEEILLSLRDVLFASMKKDSVISANSISLLGDLLRQRKNRIHFSARSMPDVLQFILIFAMSLVIFLSLLVGIKNVWLDYIFTLSIATLAYAVYMVIVDLAHPLRPGGWHLSTKDYEVLLQRIKNRSVQNMREIEKAA